MITYTVAYWQLDKAVDKINSWKATCVAYYLDEVGNAHAVERRNRAWYQYNNKRLTPEQVRDLHKIAACALIYKAATGTLTLVLVPAEQSQAAKQKLVNLVEKDMTHGVRNKGQRSKN